MSRHARWVVACTLAEAIGIGTAGLAAVAIAAAVGTPDSLPSRLAVLGTMAAAGAVEGGALGALQWRVLRERLPRLRRGEWVGITVAVAVIGWLAGMAGPVLSDPGDGGGAEPSLAVMLVLAAGMGAGAGVVFGAAQWLVLRRHARHAGRWIWIHVPGWALAMAAIFLGASLPDAGWPLWGIALSALAGGALGGALLGLVTGVVARDLEPWVDERGSAAGKVCVVTGGSRGIGLEIVRGLARLGATVVVLARDVEGARRAVPGAVHVVPCDLASLASVRDAAATVLAGWSRVDVLVHSAGTISSTRALSTDGLERTLAVDVVAPFLLTSLLRDRLEAARGRVVTLTGIYQRRGHVALDDLGFERRSYTMGAANAQAQRARLLFTAELARRAPRLTAVAVHPGGVLTAPERLTRAQRALVATVMRPGFMRPELGAAPAIRLAVEPALGAVSGRFFDRFRCTADAPDAATAEAFWRACEEMTAAFAWHAASSRSSA